MVKRQKGKKAKRHKGKEEGALPIEVIKQPDA